jgi:hypothetical protein
MSREYYDYCRFSRIMQQPRFSPVTFFSSLLFALHFHVSTLARKTYNLSTIHIGMNENSIEREKPCFSLSLSLSLTRDYFIGLSLLIKMEQKRQPTTGR